MEPCWEVTETSRHWDSWLPFPTCTWWRPSTTSTLHSVSVCVNSTADIQSSFYTSQMMECVFQSGIKRRWVCLTGCGTRPPHSCRTLKRPRMRTRCSSSRRERSRWAHWHTCCAASRQTPGNTHTHACWQTLIWVTDITEICYKANSNISCHSERVSGRCLEGLVCVSYRGIFRLLAEFQLENKDNPAYTGEILTISDIQYEGLRC